MTLFGSEQRAYQRGVEDARRTNERSYLDGWQEGVESQRIVAFGAIRRAAEVARDEDYWADDYAKHGNHVSSAMCEASAESVRAAIRAAIGSVKP